jgi:hypothetical protein
MSCVRESSFFIILFCFSLVRSTAIDSLLLIPNLSEAKSARLTYSLWWGKCDSDYQARGLGFGLGFGLDSFVSFFLFFRIYFYLCLFFPFFFLSFFFDCRALKKSISYPQVASKSNQLFTSLSCAITDDYLSSLQPLLYKEAEELRQITARAITAAIVQFPDSYSNTQKRIGCEWWQWIECAWSFFFFVIEFSLLLIEVLFIILC